jgi:D-tyrosyl-tRNA(Tyr) deacylase
MRSVIQRVSRASVVIGATIKASIGRGLLVLVGIEDADGQKDVDWLAGKIARLRIFNDADGVMNLSVKDVGGDLLVVSQFTLHGDVRKGNRPSYNRASKPERAMPLYRAFVEKLAEERGGPVATGEFGAKMEVHLANDGPVTIWIDTKEPSSGR